MWKYQLLALAKHLNLVLMSNEENEERRGEGEEEEAAGALGPHGSPSHCFQELIYTKHGCASEEIYEKVFKQRYQEPLREDCPCYLQDIINQCRDFDPSKRPSAEGIVNQLLFNQDGSRDSLTI